VNELKKMIFKIGFVIASYSALHFGYDVVRPMVIADSAVSQLQDSDFAYQQFKGVQRAFDFYWVLYLLPLLVFTKDIKKSIKKSSN
jgi:hypothetical protein